MHDAAVLQRAGLASPDRLVRLIRAAIDSMELDLSGLTVLTEAASGPYVVTPVIAALAGAQLVLALTRDSRYATAEEVVAQTRALESLCGIKQRIEIHTSRSATLFEQADIVTNLGFVRPIDAAAVAAMKPGAVIPLMFEAWEFRSEDIDLAACRRRGVAVLGTNEDFPGVDVFGCSGAVCLKLLFDAQIEVRGCKIVVVSSDKFGPVIERALTDAGARVRLLSRLQSADDVADADAIVVADYSRNDQIIGRNGDLPASAVPSGSTVIQFAGRIDVQALRDAGVLVWPGIELAAHRMAATFAALGPAPVVKLHTAGLKVAELAVRGRLSEGKFAGLAQEVWAPE
jgi:hypothetical protein